MKRTLVDARRAADAVLPQISDYQASLLREWLRGEEARAKQEATEFVMAREGEVLSMRDDALRELTTVRDAYTELAAEGGTGRISAHDYTERLNELKVRQAAADQHLAEATHIADRMEEIEDAPVEWFSGLQERMPHMMSETPL